MSTRDIAKSTHTNTGLIFSNFINAIKQEASDKRLHSDLQIALIISGKQLHFHRTLSNCKINWGGFWKRANWWVLDNFDFVITFFFVLFCFSIVWFSRLFKIKWKKRKQGEKEEKCSKKIEWLKIHWKIWYSL